jgi:hypothetical protein
LAIAAPVQKPGPAKGISFGLEDFRRLGVAGPVVLEIIKFVLTIPLGAMVWLDFWILFH